LARPKRKRDPYRKKPLDDRQLLAITLISSGKRLKREEIAELCGVSRMQLWRWEQRKDFRKALEKAYKERLRRWRSKRVSGKTYVDLALEGDVEALQTVVSIAYGIA
jgi:predicted DNA-binding transcriptional regulator AlpA